MINVRGLANRVVQNVNPNTSVVWVQSAGYTTDAAGHRVPTTTSTTVPAQVQALSASDMAHTDGLNIEGVKRTVIMYGNVQGVVRTDQKGGDMLQFPEIPSGSVKNWRVVSVVETWPTWARVVVVLQ